VSDEPSDTVVEQETQTEETVAEDTGDVLQTEANVEQTEATGMTTSIRPRTGPQCARTGACGGRAAGFGTADCYAG
jgi:hypothetical protein